MATNHQNVRNALAMMLQDKKLQSDWSMDRGFQYFIRTGPPNRDLLDSKSPHPNGQEVFVTFIFGKQDWLQSKGRVDFTITARITALVEMEKIDDQLKPSEGNAIYLFAARIEKMEGGEAKDKTNNMLQAGQYMVGFFETTHRSGGFCITS